MKKYYKYLKNMKIVSSGFLKTKFNNSYTSVLDYKDVFNYFHKINYKNCKEYIEKNIEYNILNNTFIENDNICDEFKIFDWYEYQHSLLERYIIAKIKSYKNNRIKYLIFDYYYYFLCSEEELLNDKDLLNVKNDIDNFKCNNQKYIIFNDFNIITVKNNEKYYDFGTYINKKINSDTNILNKKTNFYLFCTNFKIPPSKSNYEQSFKDIRFFYCLNNINPSGSYKFENINVSYLNGNKDYIYIKEENIKNIFSDKNIIDDKKINYNILSFDIECKHDGTFPNPNKFPISHIGVEIYSSDSNGYKKQFVLINKDIIENDNINDIIKNKNLDNVMLYDNINKYNYDKFLNYLNLSYIYFVMSEKCMLICFQNILLRMEIDYVLTFNGNRFDIPYINKRRKIYNLPELRTKNVFSKIPLKFKDTLIKATISQRLENKTDIITNGNIIFIDLYNYIKKFYERLPGYSLEIYSKLSFNISCRYKQKSNIALELFPHEKYKNNELRNFYMVLRSSNYCFINNKTYKILDKSNILPNQSLMYDNESFENSIGKSFLIYVGEDDCIQDMEDILFVYLSKDDVNIGDKKSYENYVWDKSFNHAKYCIHDSLLCRYIFEKENLHFKINAFSTIYRLPCNESLLFKSTTNVLGDILYDLLNIEKGFILKTNSINPGEWIGGKVYIPKEKFIIDLVLTFDFQSLYPTTMILGNMSPDSLVCICVTSCSIEAQIIRKKIYQDYDILKYEIIDIYNEKINKYTFIVFDKSKDGLLVKVLKKGLELRLKYKKLLKDANNRNDIVGSALYDALQYAIKIHINTIFGLTGYKNFIMNCKFVSQACTARSREYLNFVYNLIDQSKLLNNKLILNKIHDIFDKRIYIKKNIFDTDLNLNSNINFNVIYGDSVTEDTPIILKNKFTSNIEIKLIKDLVQSWNKNKYNNKEEGLNNIYYIWNHKKWSNIKKIIRHKTNKRIFRVLTNNSIVDVTEDHSLIDENFQIIKPKELKINSKLYNSYINDNILLSSSKNNFKNLLSTNLNNIKSFTENEQKMFIYGYFFRNGIINFKKEIWWLNIKTKIECKLLLYLMKKIYKNNYLTIYKSKQKYYKLIPCKKDKLNLYEFKKFYKNKNKIIPNNILNSNNNIIYSFLRGYCFNKQISFDIKNKLSCSMLCYLFSKIGYCFNISYIKDNLILNLNKNNKNNNFVKNIYTISYDKSKYVYDIDCCDSFNTGFPLLVHNTDSAMIKLEGIHNTGENKNIIYKNAIDIGNTLFKIINEEIFQKKLVFEFECVLDYMILFSRKKYTALKIIPDNIKNIKEEQKGISLLRRDYCEFHKMAISKILIKIRKIMIEFQTNKNIFNSDVIDKEIQKEVLDIIIDLIYRTYKNQVNISEFIVSQKYTGMYKDINNPTEILIRKYNKEIKQQGQIERGMRFNYIYIYNKNTLHNTNEISENKLELKELLNHIEWCKQFKSVMDLKTIVDEDTILKENQRIAIEIYIKILINEVSKISSNEKKFIENIYNKLNL